MAYIKKTYLLKAANFISYNSVICRHFSFLNLCVADDSGRLPHIRVYSCRQAAWSTGVQMGRELMSVLCGL